MLKTKESRNPLLKSKEIYREKVKTNLVEMTKYKMSSCETDCHIK